MIIQKWILVFALVILFALAISTSSLGEGVPPGEGSGGIIILGQDECPSNYFFLTTTSLSTDVSLGALPTESSLSGGSMDVESDDAWRIVCQESGDSPDGKMSLDNSILNIALQVNFAEHEILLDSATSPGDPVEIETGIATPCVDGVITPITIYPYYEQNIDPSADAGKAGGAYAISIVYKLQRI